MEGALEYDESEGVWAVWEMNVVTAVRDSRQATEDTLFPASLNILAAPLRSPGTWFL